MDKLGFIGVNVMGTPMVGHLIATGHQVFAHNRKDLLADLIAKGLVKCSSCKEVAKCSDILFIMMPDTPDVGAVLFGENGVAEGCRKERSSST